MTTVMQPKRPRNALFAPWAVAVAVGMLALGAVGLAPNPARADASRPGTVVGWGNNQYGQASMPDGLTGVTAIAAGSYHSLALKSDGTVVASGVDGDGQVSVPAGLTGVTAIAAGAAHSLALKSDGTVVGWGNNTYGQTSIPAGLTGVTAIAAGGFFGLALKSDGTVVGWGENTFGQTSVPAGLTRVTAIAAGDFHSLALKSDGTVVGWGENTVGQTSVPAGLTGVTAIAAGSHFSLALKSDCTVVGWGENTVGQTSVPAGLTGVTAIAGGTFHSLALKSDGTVVGWGYNADGVTTPPPGMTGASAIAAGELHSLALARVPSPLVGSWQVQRNVDSNPAGTAEAFQYTATDDGTTTRLSVYIDEASTARKVILGLYTNTAADDPGTLLTSGTITKPTAGQWNSVTIRATSLRAGTKYWLALLTPVKAGTIMFRDTLDGTGGPTQTSAQKSATRLPKSWKTGTRYRNSPASLQASAG